MKKFIALVLIVVMCVSLVACGNNTTYSKDELLNNSKPLTREEIDKSINNLAYAKGLIGTTYTFNGDVIEVREDYADVTFHITDENGIYTTNEFVLSANLYLPLDELKLLEVGQRLSFVGTLDDATSHEENIPDFATQTVIDMVFKSIAIVSDRFEATGKLDSKNMSYGENSWNIKIPDNNVLKLVYFRDDVSSYEGKEITYSYKITSKGCVDAYIVE